MFTTPAAHGEIPQLRCEVSEGLPALRRHWILERGDVEEYEGRNVEPIDDGYLTFEAAHQARQKEKGTARGFSRAQARSFARKAGPRVTQMHYARRGIITPEMEFIAIRENLGRFLEARRRSAAQTTALHCSTNIEANPLAPQSPNTSPRNSFVTRSPAAALSFPQTSIIRNPSR